MPSIEETGRTARAVQWTARRRFVGPLSWGLLSGLTLGPLVFGAAIPGYIIGRAGGGRERVLLWIGGLLLGITLLIGWIIASSANSACHSCVDSVIILPFASIYLLIPYGIGHWLGRRAWRKAQPSSP